MLKERLSTQPLSELLKTATELELVDTYFISGDSVSLCSGTHSYLFDPSMARVFLLGLINGFYARKAGSIQKGMLQLHASEMLDSTLIPG